MNVVDGCKTEASKRPVPSHYAEAVRIDDLAGVASMSVTSLHRHFLALTSLSPMQYQKRIRLQEARSRLLSRSQDVAAVGFSVGYESPSQFSREYKRLFGTPPRKDREGLRSMDEFSQTSRSRRNAHRSNDARSAAVTPEI